METYLFISEGLLAAIAILSWISAMIYSSRLTSKLKQNYPERYGELTGAKRIGDGWVGEGRTSKAVSYLFTNQDNQIAEIFNLKKNTKKGILFALLCAIGFLINGLVFVIISVK